MATHQQMKRLEKEADLVYALREAGKTEGGRMSELGVDVIYALLKNDYPQTDIAKLFDITPSAVSQWATKMLTDR